MYGLTIDLSKFTPQMKRELQADLIAMYAKLKRDNPNDTEIQNATTIISFPDD